MLGREIVEKSKIAFRARAPGRRNPHSSSSPGKPDTWQRGVGDPMAGTESALGSDQVSSYLETWSDLTRLHPISGSQPRRAFQSCTNSERLHSGRSGIAESKIQPLLRDQCLAGQFGPLRQNVRAIPRAVLAWLAAHGFQPDLVCKSHWTAGKVGVRAHGAWGHEVLERHL